MSSFPPPPEARAKSTPILKRWWFWAAVIVVILIAAGASSSDPDETTAGGETKTGGVSAPTAVQPTATGEPTPTMAVVPKVVGDRIETARPALMDAGFAIEVKQQESAKPKGTVISQSPKGGTSAKPGRTVALVVAKPPATSTGSSGNCTAGYSPCLPPASDYDCAGGSGDGPKYVYGAVRVTGSDPYGLDADNDGYGCE